MLNRLRQLFVKPPAEFVYSDLPKSPLEYQNEEWRALNQQFIDAAKAGDWHAMKMAHFQQAMMNFRRGRNHRRLAGEPEWRMVQVHVSACDACDRIAQ